MKSLGLSPDIPAAPAPPPPPPGPPKLSDPNIQSAGSFATRAAAAAAGQGASDTIKTSSLGAPNPSTAAKQLTGQ